MPAQVGLPVGDRRGRQLGGEGLEEIRVRKVDLGERRRAQIMKVGRPVQVAGVLREVGHGHLVVARVRVAELDLLQRCLRQQGFQPHDGLCADLCVLGGVAGQLEHLRDVRDVLCAELLRLLIVGEVVLAFRQAEAALAELRNLEVAVLRVGTGPEAEARGHALDPQMGHDAEHVGAGLDRGDEVEVRLQRLDPHRVDRILIHAAVVIIPHHLLERGGAGLQGSGALADGAQVGLVAFGQLGEAAPARLVGGDGRVLDPLAVGVAEKIVLRFDRRIDGLEVNLGARTEDEGKRGCRREGEFTHKTTVTQLGETRKPAVPDGGVGGRMGGSEVGRVSDPPGLIGSWIALPRLSLRGGPTGRRGNPIRKIATAPTAGRPRNDNRGRVKDPPYTRNRRVNATASRTNTSPSGQTFWNIPRRQPKSPMPVL